MAKASTGRKLLQPWFDQHDTAAVDQFRKRYEAGLVSILGEWVNNPRAIADIVDKAIEQLKQYATCPADPRGEWRCLALDIMFNHVRTNPQDKKPTVVSPTYQLKGLPKQAPPPDPRNMPNE
jgi:hypothetical protein